MLHAAALKTVEELFAARATAQPDVQLQEDTFPENRVSGKTHSKTEGRQCSEPRFYLGLIFGGIRILSYPAEPRTITPLFSSQKRLEKSPMVCQPVSEHFPLE